MKIAEAVQKTRQVFYEAIAADLRAGMTQQQAASKHNCSIGTVSNVAKKLKVQKKDLVIERYLASQKSARTPSTECQDGGETELNGEAVPRAAGEAGRG